MAKYKLIGGAHREGRTTYKSGDIISSDHDLVKAFKGKFIKVPHAEAAPAPVVTPAPTAAKPAQPVLKVHTNPTTEPDTSNRGKDVTKDFKEAVKNHYLVFKRSWSHTIYNPDDMANPLNKSALKKKDVDTFIKKFVEE